MKNPALISKIKSLEALTAEEKAELIALLNNTKKYGLVWEDKPEDVEELLRTQLPVLQEVPERRILAKDLPAPAAATSGNNNPNQPGLFDEQPNAASTGSAAGTTGSAAGFTGAEPVEAPTPGPDAPNHILIEGDNLHALTALSFTHEGKIDVIYIDPPYNTGNKDFKYNDSFVDREDSYRHSKWLSFMKKRLELAKRLLSEKGVIFISIDENESHNLRILLDEIFGESNFIEQLIWNKRIPKNDKGIGNIHEYIFLYAKNYCREHIFMQKKEGIEDVNEIVALLKKRKVPIPEAEKEIKKFYKKNGYDRGITLYNSLDSEYKLWGKINVSWPNAKTFGPRYVVIHPETGKPCKVPDRGWRWTQETFLGLLDNENIVRLHDGSFICGRIWFAKDENTQPSSIKYLEEVNDFLLRSIISTKSDGSVALIDVLGESKFDYPKPIDLIHRLLSSVNQNRSTILDFFAGSGTTLHATMQLNAEDGGSRQCILVTNNENNIAEEVCYERNRRVIQGYANAKGEKVAGLTNNNLRYYRTEFVGSAKTTKNKKELTRLATELLCIKEDIYTEIGQMAGFVFDADTARCFCADNKYMLVIYDEEMIEELVPVIAAIPTKHKIKIYVFAPGQYPFTEEFEEVLDKVELCALPDAIYKAYASVLPKKTSKRHAADETQPAENQESTEVDLFTTNTPEA